MPDTNSIVIIGGGHAAAQLVTSLRMKKFHENGSKITLVSDEPALPYQRPPLSKAYLKSELTADRLPILRQSAYESAGVTLLLNDAATDIDTAGRTVSLASGRSVPYDTLILALGGRARQLDCPGAEDPRVRTLRTLADVDHMKKPFEEAAHIGIIGGGYIGLEAASVARMLGKDVTVFEAADRLLARVVAPEVSDFYHRLHTQHGVSIHTGASVTAFEAGTRIGVVTPKTGTVPVDLVLAGIGLIPNSELARKAGLAVDALGIQVDEYCRTSDPDIFAIGDVTSFLHPRYERRLRLESVQNAVDQAKTVAEVLTGTPIPYHALPWFWSDQYGIKLQIAGLSEGADQLVVRGDAMSESAAFFYLQEGRLIAADCAARVPEFMAAKKMIEANLRPDPDQLADDSMPIKDLMKQILAAQ